MPYLQDHLNLVGIQSAAESGALMLFCGLSLSLPQLSLVLLLALMWACGELDQRRYPMTN